MPTDINGFTKFDQVTITSGQNLSPAADLQNRTLMAIETPAAGWDSAAISLQVSRDNVNFVDLNTTAGEYASPALMAGKCFAVDSIYLLGYRYVKVRSGLLSAPVSQTADRLVTLVSRQVQM